MPQTIALSVFIAAHRCRLQLEALAPERFVDPLKIVNDESSLIESLDEDSAAAEKTSSSALSKFARLKRATSSFKTASKVGRILALYYILFYSILFYSIIC